MLHITPFKQREHIALTSVVQLLNKNNNEMVFNVKKVSIIMTVNNVQIPFRNWS